MMYNYAARSCERLLVYFSGMVTWRREVTRNQTLSTRLRLTEDRQSVRNWTSFVTSRVGFLLGNRNLVDRMMYPETGLTRDIVILFSQVVIFDE